MRGDLIAQLEQAVDRHGLFRSGAHVLVAVSGGLDSIVLLDLLARLAPRRALTLSVAHLDHGVRPDAADDAKVVRALARAWRLAPVEGRADPALRPAGASPEEGLRAMRRSFLEGVADRVGADCIALGHHRDDRVEWLLLRLVEGVPPDGWCMPVASGRYVRPLHDLGRDQLRTYARMRGLGWREDPTNRDLGVPRNRVRHAVLPALERALGRPVHSALAHVADAVQRDRDYFVAPVVELSRRARDGAGYRVGDLRAAPPALRDRVLAAWLVELGLEPRRPHLASLARLLDGGPGSSLDLGSGVCVGVREGRLERLPTA